MKRVGVFALLWVLGSATAGNAQNGEADPTPPCATPEARQFDFWIGSWDLEWDGGNGTNEIESLLDECVIQERFTGNMGADDVFRGMSVSSYNARSGQWQQTWVDNQGSYLDFIGGLEDGRMVLSRQAERDGQQFLQRMIFYNIEADRLDWNWERSDDGGETWELLWKIAYRRRS